MTGDPVRPATASISPLSEGTPSRCGSVSRIRTSVVYLGGSKSIGNVVFQLTVPVRRVGSRARDQVPREAVANSRAAFPESGS